MKRQRALGSHPSPTPEAKSRGGSDGISAPQPADWSCRLPPALQRPQKRHQIAFLAFCDLVNPVIPVQ